MKNALKVMAVAVIALPVLGCNEAKTPRQSTSQNSTSSQNNNTGHGRVLGAPGPIVGAAGLPALAACYGVYWLIRRRRRLALRAKL